MEYFHTCLLGIGSRASFLAPVGGENAKSKDWWYDPVEDTPLFAKIVAHYHVNPDWVFRGMLDYRLSPWLIQYAGDLSLMDVAKKHAPLAVISEADRWWGLISHAVAIGLVQAKKIGSGDSGQVSISFSDAVQAYLKLSRDLGLSWLPEEYWTFILGRQENVSISSNDKIQITFGQMNFHVTRWRSAWGKGVSPISETFSSPIETGI